MTGPAPTNTTALSPAVLTQLREAEQAATQGPWEAVQSDDGTFYGQGPTFDVLAPVDGRLDEPVACGGFIEDGGPRLGAAELPDATLIVALRNHADALIAAGEAVEAVRALHPKITLYEPCPDFNGCDARNCVEIPTRVNEYMHTDVLEAEVCGHCRDEDGTELDWPCPTVRVLPVTPDTEEAKS